MSTRREALSKALAYAVQQAFQDVGEEKLVSLFPPAFLEASSKHTEFLRSLATSLLPLVLSNAQEELQVILDELNLVNKLDELDELVKAGVDADRENNIPAWQVADSPLPVDASARLTRVMAKLREKHELESLLAAEMAKTDALRAALASSRVELDALEQAVDASQVFADDLAASTSTLAQLNPLALDIMADLRHQQ